VAVVKWTCGIVTVVGPTTTLELPEQEAAVQVEVMVLVTVRVDAGGAGFAPVGPEVGQMVTVVGTLVMIPGF